MPNLESMQRSYDVAVLNYQQKLERFDRESPDPVWAQETSAAVKSELAQTITNGQIHASVDVKCKNTLCVAEFVWPDYETAKREMDLADVPLHNCGRQMMLLPPGAAATEYRARLVLDCASRLQ